MTNPAITPHQKFIGDFAPDKSGIPASKPVEEKLQKLLDKALYANGRPSAQKSQSVQSNTRGALSALTALTKPDGSSNPLRDLSFCGVLSMIYGRNR
jgi:hypothetical protein